MPLLTPDYRPPIAFRQADINTVYAGTLRKRPRVDWERERLELPDGDFVDLDWVRAPGSDRVAVLTHGLEGHARRPYMAGMARAYRRAGYHVCAMNFRGCSGEPNRRLRSYHIGETGDLRTTLRHALRRTRARHAMLTGFSLGGNVILKLLAEAPGMVPAEVMGAATFSVPLYVGDCNAVINAARNWAYRWAFIKSLNRKAAQKSESHPEAGQFRRARRFDEYDEWYTAPWHGFAGAEDYWRRNSAGPILDRLRHPALVVNAADDSFLAESCYPRALAREHDCLHLEVPDYGGHCGWVERNGDGDYYADRRAVEFAGRLLRDRCRSTWP